MNRRPERGPRWAGLLLLGVLFNAAAALLLRPVHQSPDGVGYFAYLWSVFSERTLSFATTYQRYHGMPPARTPNGWLADHVSFGTALLWAPFVEAGRWSRAFAAGADPLSPREAFCLASFGSMVLGSLCLVLLTSALGAGERIRRRLLVAGLTLFGTPLFFYSFAHTTYSHAATAFASGLFVWYWLRSSREEAPLSPLRWGTLGLLGGLAACVRTQEVLVLIAPAWEWLGRCRGGSRERRGDLARAAAALAGGFLVGFSPQALVWRLLYGSFLAAPAAFNMAWSNFALGPTLFSSYHGLLTWTPLYAVALAGLAWEARRSDSRAGPLALILIGQILINSFCMAWWNGLSFGLRQLTGTSLIAGLGVAFFLRRSADVPKPWRALGLPAACLCSLWTALLALRGYAGTLDLFFYVSPRELAATVVRLGPAFSGAAAALRGGGFVIAEIWAAALLSELAAGLWLWRLLAIEKTGRPWLSSTRWLLLTAALLVLFADGAVLRARRGARPDFAPGTYLDSAQVGDLYASQTHAVEAVYYAQSGDAAAARDYFSRAESELPASPAAEPWRQTLQSWRRELFPGPAAANP